MSETKFEELPLHYRHPNQEGTLILSVAIDEKEEIINGYYFWAIQNDVGEATDHQVIKGLVKLNEIRNQFIGEGWRRWLPPKIKTAAPRQETRAKEKVEEKNNKQIRLDVKKKIRQEKQAEERRAAFQQIKEKVQKEKLSDNK